MDSVAYGLYFLYPATILGLIYSRGDLFKFREVALAFVICVVGEFTGYVTVPAVGPRYYPVDEYTVSLSGYITEAGARAWNSIEPVKRDCFPSLHTAMSTITLVYFYRFRNFYKYGITTSKLVNAQRSQQIWIKYPVVIFLHNKKNKNIFRLSFRYLRCV